MGTRNLFNKLSVTTPSAKKKRACFLYGLKQKSSKAHGRKPDTQSLTVHNHQRQSKTM